MRRDIPADAHPVHILLPLPLHPHLLPLLRLHHPLLEETIHPLHPRRIGLGKLGHPLTDFPLDARFQRAAAPAAAGAGEGCGVGGEGGGCEGFFEVGGVEGEGLGWGSGRNGGDGGGGGKVGV